MTRNHNLKRIIELYIKAHSTFNIEGMLKHLHRDIVFQNITNGVLTFSSEGKATFRDAVEQTKTLFILHKQTIRDLKISGDTATVEIEYKGISVADFPNGPKKGEKIQLNGVSEFVFKGNKIIRLTDKC